MKLESIKAQLMNEATERVIMLRGAIQGMDRFKSLEEVEETTTEETTEDVE